MPPFVNWAAPACLNSSKKHVRMRRASPQAFPNSLEQKCCGGLRSTYHRTRADYMQSGVFRVRYWSLKKLEEVFSRQIGPSSIKAEAYGGLGLLEEDFGYVNAKAKCLIVASLILKRLASVFPPFIALADSVYVIAPSTGSATPSGKPL